MAVEATLAHVLEQVIEYGCYAPNATKVERAQEDLGDEKRIFAFPNAEKLKYEGRVEEQKDKCGKPGRSRDDWIVLTQAARSARTLSLIRR